MFVPYFTQELESKYDELLADKLRLQKYFASGGTLSSLVGCYCCVAFAVLGLNARAQSAVHSLNAVTTLTLLLPGELTLFHIYAAAVEGRNEQLSTEVAMSNERSKAHVAELEGLRESSSELVGAMEGAKCLNWGEMHVCASLHRKATA